MAATVKKSNPQTCVCAFLSQFRRRDGGRDSPQLRDLASDPQIDGRRITVTVSLNGRSIDSVRPVNALYIFEEISIKKKRKKRKRKERKTFTTATRRGIATSYDGSLPLNRN